MHAPRRAWRNFIAVAALVTFALPLASPLATPVNAQTPGNQSFAAESIDLNGGPCSSNTSATCIVSADPGVAFNVIGTTHSVTLTCGEGINPNPSATPEPFPGLDAHGNPIGCYNVSASLTDETTGTAGTFTYARCGSNSTDLAGSTVNCSSYQSPLCPQGFFTDINAGTGPCGSRDPNAPQGSQLLVQFNPGAPHSYLVTFTGYILPFADGTCPAGTTAIPGPFQLTTSTGVPPFQGPVTAPGGVCQFTVSAEKKYIEITSLTLTGTGPCAAGAATSSLVFAEGLKQFFGLPCTLTATANGITILKSGVDCSAEPPATSSAPPADFPAGSVYQCIGGTLSVKVTNIGSQLNSGAIPITVSVTGGTASIGLTGPTLGTGAGTLCSANSNQAFGITFTGTAFNVCTFGPGSGSVRACVTTAQGFNIDTQPGVCSNTVTFAYSLPNQQRVVPYIRWSGEKQVLTKCFGGAGNFAFQPVEFTLEGAGADAGATLLPTSLGGDPGVVGGGNPANGAGFPSSLSQNTVITLTDVDGCASVIVYASGEGVVNVDAALYSTGPGPNNGASLALNNAPMINEHAFEIFYLKFDHIDLENIKFNSVNASAFNPLPLSGLGFSSTAASFTLPNAPGTNPPGAAGYSIPLCNFDYMRAMVHGYFEWKGDPSGRPATTVGIGGAPSGAAGSYVLPAGRWVLPEDWPVLATFAGFDTNSFDRTPTSPFSWDLNSGFVFNQSENPVYGVGGAGINAAQSRNPASAPSRNSVGAIPPSQVAEGPFFGIDHAGQKYSTAPAGPSCTTGLTVGIGPFDPTQACTNGGPLTFQPSGSLVLTASATGFNFGFLSSNSTYLPNGTLNEYDAPMPAAQVTFNITSGPGFLNQVNKTGLYSINTVDGNGNVNGAVYPDPFYATAIPASPLIPPVDNNGGYLWDTFGSVTGRAAATTTGFPVVAGETTRVSSLPFGPCSEAGGTQGFTSVTGPIAGNTAPTPGCFIGAGGAADTTVTAGQCTAVGETFFPNTANPATGVCRLSRPVANADGTFPGGINVTNFGAACPSTAGLRNFPSSSNQVEVANGQFFFPGETVFVYSSTTGETLLGGQSLIITNVSPLNSTGLTTLTFAPNFFTPDAAEGENLFANVCIPAFQAVFVSNQIGIPVNNAVAFGAGQNVTIDTPADNEADTFVAIPRGGVQPTNLFPVNAANSLVFLEGSDFLARALGGCLLSRSTTLDVPPYSPGACEPATFLPPGSELSVTANAPVLRNGGDLLGNGQGLYPFWQWVPNPATAASRPSSATVYSDNHGESVVSLETGVVSQVAPVNGACPTGFFLTPGAVNCILDLSTLGTSNAPGGTAFQNVAAAGAFKAATPGCVATTVGGGTTATTAITPVVGATGPTQGQICVNNLGGIEFGSGATLGATTVQAVADYPYFRLHPAISSGQITKIFTSMFAKTLSVSPLPGGIAGPAGTVTYTVTITGTDICGNPIVGEPVNVFALTGAAGAVVLAPQGSNAQSNGTSAATVFLNANGTATLSLEVLSQSLGTSGLVIKAVFPLERIERFVTVAAGTSSTTNTQQLYPPGYNMVGGPAGTNFGSAEALFTFDPTANTYAQANSTNVSSAAPTCVGYYAYFASATAVNINVTSKAGDTATCNLKAGWNLVGNPFGSAAQLPSGTTAYHFNPTAQTYDVVSSIPLGGAVFIYETAATSITLTAT